jgi:hypothetical protein
MGLCLWVAFDDDISIVYKAIGAIVIAFFIRDRFIGYLKNLQSYVLDIDISENSLEVVYDLLGVKSRYRTKLSKIGRVNVFVSSASENDKPPLWQPRKHFRGCRYVILSQEELHEESDRKIQFTATQTEIDWLVYEINSFIDLKEKGISLNVTYAEEAEKAYQQRKKNSQTYPQPQDDS